MIYLLSAIISYILAGYFFIGSPLPSEEKVRNCVILIFIGSFLLHMYTPGKNKIEPKDKLIITHKQHKNLATKDIDNLHYTQRYLSKYINPPEILYTSSTEYKRNFPSIHNGNMELENKTKKSTIDELYDEHKEKSIDEEFNEYYGSTLLVVPYEDDEGTITNYEESKKMANSPKKECLKYIEPNCFGSNYAFNNNINYEKLDYYFYDAVPHFKVHSAKENIFIIDKYNEKYRYKIINDIEKINMFIYDAGCITNIALPMIEPEIIKFDESNDSQTGLEYHPYTKTGKDSKFPVILMIYTSILNNLTNYTIHIHYLKSGKIGKAMVALFFNRKIYKIYLAIKHEELLIRRIDEFIDGIPTHIYEW